MPNWTHNAIRLPAAAAARVFDYDAATGSIDFSFDRVMPMPPSLWVASGNGDYSAFELAEALEALRESDPAAGVEDLPADVRARAEQELPLDRPSFGYHCDEYEALFADGPITDLDGMARLGSLYLANKREHGARDWYHWRLDRWGTKWDAGEVEVERHGSDLVIRFNTAWSPVSGELYGAICDAVGEEVRYEAAYEEDGFREVWLLDRNGETPLAGCYAEMIVPTPMGVLMRSRWIDESLHSSGLRDKIESVTFADVPPPAASRLWEDDLGQFGNEVQGSITADGALVFSSSVSCDVVLSDDSPRLLAGLPALREVDLTTCDLTTCEPDLSGLFADCPALAHVALRPEQAGAIADAALEGRADGMFAGCESLDVADTLGEFHTPDVEEALRGTRQRRKTTGPRR